MVANHPYGILDGLGTLSLVESLGRPYRVLINKDLMKVPEIRPYSLPIDFAPTRAGPRQPTSRRATKRSNC